MIIQNRFISPNQQTPTNTDLIGYSRFRSRDHSLRNCSTRSEWRETVGESCIHTIKAETPRGQLCGLSKEGMKYTTRFAHA